ncbi:etoposide-induced protein 2.4 homolog [Lineus longissimus]|uniref:etoposide-induced protein 2.4 homolog n=1 Tax=Lineus longissimus TaxID=88925 RepID=UPI002B4FACE8
MADTIKLITLGIAKGLQDAILGSLRVYKLDHEGREEVEEVQQTSEPRSTLAKRRAEKMKGMETKTSTKKEEPKVLQRIVLCCAWNGGVFWASMLIFNSLLMPLIHYMTELLFNSSSSQNLVWARLGPMLSWTFSTLWVLPLFILSKIVNSLWFRDIAEAAYRKSRGRPQLPSLSKMIADVLFSIVLQIFFLIQGMLARYLPIHGVGELVSLIHMCLLYSLYAFEYKWFNMGWEVHKRVSYIETNWPYFVGFGLPLAVLTALPSSLIISGCVFSILFPLFIISGNEAAPIQQSYCEFPLRLFSFVISISNAIFHRANRGNPPSVRGTPAGSPAKHGILKDPNKTR